MIKVSIIIPFYNSESFLTETIESCLLQEEKSFELLLINDGSTDNSANVVKRFNDKRLFLYDKNNSGVSDSRNFGLDKSKGEYIVFLDSDDILEANFLSKRIAFLEGKVNRNFCSGRVKIINDNSEVIDTGYRGTSEQLVMEILLYNKRVITCPSNYMFRRDFLVSNKICFNTNLSSSADRFFLLEVSKYALGGLVSDGDLKYRVHHNSMSHKYSRPLQQDNIKYHKLILEHQLAPQSILYIVKFKNYYVLCGLSFHVKDYFRTIQYGIQAFLISPFVLMKNLLRKL